MTAENYRKRSPEERDAQLARNRARYHADIETNRARQKQYREEHKELYRAAYRRHDAKRRDARAAYRAATAKRRKDIALAYYASHKQQYLAYVHIRRARKLANGGEYTPNEWEALKARYNYRCLRCGQTEPTIKLTLDHVVPLAQGGANTIDNLQPLCGRCNRWKGNRVHDYRPKAA